MSARSEIIVHRADGKWARSYCHFDGYVGHNGRILFEHYNSQERAEELVALGDLFSLAPSCACPPGHSFSTPVKGYCVAYGREGPKTVDELAGVWPDGQPDYTYIWSEGRWLVSKRGKPFKTLAPWMWPR